MESSSKLLLLRVALFTDMRKLADTGGADSVPSVQCVLGQWDQLFLVCTPPGLRCILVFQTTSCNIFLFAMEGHTVTLMFKEGGDRG